MKLPVSGRGRTIRGRNRSADSGGGCRVAEDQSSADPENDPGRPDPCGQDRPRMARGPDLFAGVPGSAYGRHTVNKDGQEDQLNMSSMLARLPDTIYFDEYPIGLPAAFKYSSCFEGSSLKTTRFSLVAKLNFK